MTIESHVIFYGSLGWLGLFLGVFFPCYKPALNLEKDNPVLYYLQQCGPYIVIKF